MKKNTLRILTSVMVTAMLLNGCGLMKKADASIDTVNEMRKQDNEEKTVTEDQPEWSEEVIKSKDEPEHKPENKPEIENATPAETSDSADNESSESASLAATDSSDLPYVGTVVSFRGWKSNQGEDGYYTFFSFDESDYDLNFDYMISLENMTSEQIEYINANLYEEFEVSFIYTEDMGEYNIHTVEPVSIEIVPEDTASAALYSADTDPLRGLVADDILDKYRATNPVKNPDSVYEEGKRLGHWIQKTIGKDGFSEEIREMGRHIGNANEYCFGTDIGNNFDNNFPYFYAEYFALKDYYTSEGTRNTEAYESLIDWNNDLGDGDPKSIEEMYEDLKEFITVCNNVIRGNF